MGFGDELMAAGEARVLRRARPRARVVVGDGHREIWSEIFDGNPNLTRLADVRPGDDVIWLRNYYGCRPYLDYGRSIGNQRQVFTPYRAMRGDIACSAAEQARAGALLCRPARAGLPLVSIEPHVALTINKDWGFGKWQAVVDALHECAVFVQPDYGKRMLRGAHAIRATFREYCAVLARCALHVGPEGGLHHAAAAVRRPAVVVFGGRIDPAITGYAGHANLYVDVRGSPCGMITPCAHCRDCLDAITVDSVVTAIRRRLRAPRRGRARAPLAPVRGSARPARSRAGDTARSPRG
jgi:hypothetical protein